MAAANRDLKMIADGQANALQSSNRYPTLYQINTRVWLAELSEKLGRPANLDDIEDIELERFKAMGFESLWFLSVWQTGALGQKVSRSQPGWLAEFRDTLPDLQDADIEGSGFSIADYRVHKKLGGDLALERLRKRLNERGQRLWLDFVPNHVGLDHVFLEEHPEYFIAGSEDDLASSPQNFVRVRNSRGELILAHGRDPYFDGWPDTLQLNYAHAGLRQAMMDELLRIAGQCDGVRCDMAMLVLPEIFERTWGEQLARGGGQGESYQFASFWPEAIAYVRARYPQFCFMAEVYWDMEWTLQQQGFDFTYDKRLYDRLRSADAGAVRGHLLADLHYQSAMARFLENHDEPRAAATFGPAQHQAAALLTYLTPGLRFFHQGQLEGKQKRISPHPVRGPAEATDRRLQTFYEKLLKLLQTPLYHQGQWRLLSSTPAWEGNWTADCFISFFWQGDHGERQLVIVNYSDHQSQCHLPLSMLDQLGLDIQEGLWRLQDDFNNTVFDRDGSQLRFPGLYVDLGPWQYHIFTLTQLEKESLNSSESSSQNLQSSWS